MKYLFIYCFLSIALPTKAQDDFFNPYFHFSKNDKAYILNTGIYAYEYAGFRSKKLDKLKIGEEINIISRSDSIDFSMGFRVPWYRISYKKKGQLKEAFIWAGALALDVQKDENNKDLIFMYGLSAPEIIKRQNHKKGQLNIKCLAVQKKRKIAQIEFSAVGDIEYYRNFTISKGLGLKSIKNILNFEFRNNYYVGEYGTQVLFWDGKKFIFVKKLENFGDPPCYFATELIYPEMETGKKNLILQKTSEGCMEDPEMPIKTIIAEYKWERERLLLLTEYKIE